MEPTALPQAPALDARFLTLAAQLPELVSLHAAGGGCLYVCDVARELLGVEPAEMVGCDWAELVPAEDENPFREGAERSVKHRMLRPYGPPLVAETSVSLVAGSDQLLCVTRGLDARGWELPDALCDRLTGLPNRDVLVNHLGALLAEGQTAVAALVIDLDHLSAIGERFGREAAERVLAETARRVCEMLRPSDLLGRIEGDRLCALCLGVDDHRVAVRIAERVRAVVARPLPFTPVLATASVGAALGPAGGDAESVLRLAAAELHSA